MPVKFVKHVAKPGDKVVRGKDPGQKEKKQVVPEKKPVAKK